MALSLAFAFGVIRLVIQTYGQRLERAITLLEELTAFERRRRR